MNLKEISALSAGNIEQLVKQQGVYLSTRQEPKFFIDLYRLESLLIEIYYHHKQPEYNFVKVGSKDNILLFY
jgi:hypothetical protein